MTHISLILSLTRCRLMVAALMALGFCNVSMAETAMTHLCIHFVDGKCSSYTLSSDPEIAFAENELTIRTNGIDVTYPLDDVSRITYGDENGAGVYDLEHGESPYRIDNGYILFSNLAEGTIVDIYDINGAVVRCHQAEVAGEYRLPVRDLSPGIYIVRVNNTTFKIATK